MEAGDATDPSSQKRGWNTALAATPAEAIHRVDVPYTSSGHRRDATMINGAHAIFYSDDADATRATLAKVLGDPVGRHRRRLADLRLATGRDRRPPGEAAWPGRALSHDRRRRRHRRRPPSRGNGDHQAGQRPGLGLLTAITLPGGGRARPLPAPAPDWGALPN
jgi:hypothetical protein